MKINLMIAVVFILLLFGSRSLAYQTAIIGGIQNGAALGLLFEEGYTDNAKVRFGFEANTSSNISSIAFIGGKWFLGDLNDKFPLFLSSGLTGYMGNNAAAGLYVSAILERFLDVRPLFLEFGMDMVNSIILQFRVGYYF